MTDFTKGEWSISLVGDATYIDSHTGLTIARVFDMEGSPHDANLMVSAPDMYEMLEMLVNGDSINDHSIEREVVTLLAKARGEIT